jgi:hypothetical protein
MQEAEKNRQANKKQQKNGRKRRGLHPVAL